MASRIRFSKRIDLFVLLPALLIGAGVAPAGAADFRVIDDAEKTLNWTDGKLGDSSVVKSIKLSTAQFQSTGHSIQVTLDSLDGTQDTVTKLWPRQAGVQTNAIPAGCVNISAAKRLRISLFAARSATSGTGTLQARIFIKTGPNWLWETTEALDGNAGMTQMADSMWTTIESPVETFYNNQTVAGILFPDQLKSFGVQFFTWGGAWSGDVYLDDAQIVDVVPAPADALRAARGRTSMPLSLQQTAVYRLDGKRVPLGWVNGAWFHP